MTQPSPEFNPHHQCHGKRQYVRKQFARKRARQMETTGTGHLVAYLCPHCAFYHIGHPVPRK